MLAAYGTAVRVSARRRGASHCKYSLARQLTKLGRQEANCCTFELHSQETEEALMARGGGKAPKQITWMICLVLYLVALLAHFAVIRISGNVADWAWIIGFGLLLAAVQIRGL